jgi:hypothetical protein
VTSEATCADGTGRYRHYEHGSIYWTPTTGAHAVRGAIWHKWRALGYENGPNGYPTTDEGDVKSGLGRYNNFQNGTIIWLAGTNEAFSVHGAIYTKWGELDWDAGELGFPTSDETSTPDGVGRFNHFEHGSIYWTPSTGAQVVKKGAIGAAWASQGHEAGQLGFPVSGEEVTPGTNGQGRYQVFQGGDIYCTPRYGARVALDEVIRLPVVVVKVANDDGSHDAGDVFSDVTIRDMINDTNAIYEPDAGIRFALQDITTLTNTRINRLSDWSIVGCPEAEATIPNPDPVLAAAGKKLSPCQKTAYDHAAQEYPGKIVVYIRRQTYVAANMDREYPKPIAGHWPGLPSTFNQGIDAALWRESNGRIYFFKGSEYVRFLAGATAVESGYPKPIAEHWPGLPEDFKQGIDAALLRGDNGKIYFFKGSQYVRFSNVNAGVDATYPKPIADHWRGLPSSFRQGIDAAFWNRRNSKLYFFKGDEYVRFSDVETGVDDGYPQRIRDHWLKLPDDFQPPIDAALWRESNSRIYLFRGSEYVRFTFAPCEITDEGGGGFSHKDLNFIALSSWDPAEGLGDFVPGGTRGQAPYSYLAHELGHYFDLNHTMPNRCPETIEDAIRELGEYIKDKPYGKPDDVPDNLPDLVWNEDGLIDTPGDPGRTVYNLALFGHDSATPIMNPCVGAGEFVLEVEWPGNQPDQDPLKFTVKPARHNIMSYTSACPYFPGNTTGETRARITPQQRDIILNSVRHGCRRYLSRAPYNVTGTGTWGRGWSHLMPFELDGRPHFIAYNSTTGEMHYNRMHEPPVGTALITGYSTLSEVTFGKGWSQLMPFTLDSKPYFIAYHPSSGAIPFARINDDGKGSVVLSIVAWSTGWSQLMPFSLHSKPHFIAYNAATGEVHFYRINDDGNGFLLLEEGTLGKGWSQLVPFTLKNKPHFVAYDSATGELHFYRINDNGKGFAILRHDSLGKGWTQLIPYWYPHQGQRWMLIAYNSATGELRFYRIRDDGKALDIHWKENWAPHWSLLMPFYMPISVDMGRYQRVPFFASYMAKCGKANLHQLTYSE